jgi:uncharacterized phage-associated protein
MLVSDDLHKCLKRVLLQILDEFDMLSVDRSRAKTRQKLQWLQTRGKKKSKMMMMLRLKSYQPS